MCGRFTNEMTWRELHEGYTEFLESMKAPPSNLQPRYNIAPTQDAMVIRKTPSGGELVSMRWGLIPSWSKGPDPKFTNINARAETVEKAAPVPRQRLWHRFEVVI